MSDSEKKSGDPGDTQVGGEPPRAPRPDPAPADADESTGIRPMAAPPVPKRPESVAPTPVPPAEAGKGAAPPVAEDTSSRQVAPPPPPQKAAEAAGESEAEEGTRLFKREAVTLTRTAPREHFGTIPLEDRPYRMGRSSSCDIPLFSPEASRDHARLRKEAQGWVIEPQPGKLVLVNGASIAGPVNLGQKARLRLGGDDLLFVDENAAAPSPASPASAPPAAGALAAEPRAGRRTLWIAVAAALLVAAALAALLMGR